MNVSASLITNSQATIAIEPRQRALNDPAMPSESLATFNAAPCDARCNPSPSQFLAQCLRVIRFVGVQLHRSCAWSAAPPLDWLDGIHGLKTHARVVDIGGTYRDGERDALPVHDHMAFRARFAALRWIRPGFIAPFWARTDEESSAARDQSMRSASPSRSSST